MAQKNTFYITTPIYYPSDNLHIGHAYTTVAADAMARFKRITGHDVWFLTGSDEHGQKIERTAKAKGQTPKEYVDKIVAGFENLWETLEITNDDFIRTTEERHKRVVQQIFQKLYDQGDIYKAGYKGWYCTPCETFWTEGRLEEGNCPDCGRPVEFMEEESYFFRMSEYADRLLKHIEDNPDFIQPVSRRNEMVSFIKSGLEDLCVSRTTFDWGIQVPFDPKHVVYVWIDALTNYISALGYGSEDDTLYQKFWPADVHLMAKDIVRFHSIIWPIILMAAGLPLPKRVIAHGWLLLEGGKMSKSKGNIVDPMVLIDKYGLDAIRYYLLRELPFGADGYYSEEALVHRINQDLANDLGNLFNRTAAMVKKYFDGVLQRPDSVEGPDSELIELAQKTPRAVEEYMDRMEISNALASIWQLVGRANKYLEETSPWALAKDPEKRDRCNAVLYNVAECMRMVTVMVGPFMPQFPPRAWPLLGLENKTELHTWESLTWGRMSGTTTKKGKPLFPRIDPESLKD
jgi:methionyl-tRNA synthetase